MFCTRRLNNVDSRFVDYPLCQLTRLGRLFPFEVLHRPSEFEEIRSAGVESKFQLGQICSREILHFGSPLGENGNKLRCVASKEHNNLRDTSLIFKFDIYRLKSPSSSSRNSWSVTSGARKHVQNPCLLFPDEEDISVEELLQITRIYLENTRKNCPFSRQSNGHEINATCNFNLPFLTTLLHRLSSIAKGETSFRGVLHAQAISSVAPLKYLLIWKWRVTLSASFLGWSWFNMIQRMISCDKHWETLAVTRPGRTGVNLALINFQDLPPN